MSLEDINGHGSPQFSSLSTKYYFFLGKIFSRCLSYGFEFRVVLRDWLPTKDTKPSLHLRLLFNEFLNTMPLQRLWLSPTSSLWSVNCYEFFGKTVEWFLVAFSTVKNPDFFFSYIGCHWKSKSLTYADI